LIASHHIVKKHMASSTRTHKPFVPETVSMRDRVSRAGLDTVATEDTAAVINVINAGVSLTAAESNLLGVLGGFNINAFCGTCRRTQETRHALLESVLIALQNVNAAVAFLEIGRCVRIVFRKRRLQHFAESDAHSLCNRGCRSKDFADLGHRSFRLAQSPHPTGEVSFWSFSQAEISASFRRCRTALWQVARPRRS